MRIPGFRNFLLIYTFIPVLLLTGCGSDSDKKKSNTGFFSGYGLGAGDVILIEIASPEVTMNSGSTGGTGAAYQKTAALDAGTTVQLSVTARDVKGTSYPNIPVVWSSENQ